MKNRITELLSCEYPLIQGPMRWITLGEMAAAVSNSGGFGQIAASGLAGDRLRKEIEVALKLTDRPIGVNIPIYRPNAAEALEIAIDMGLRIITTSAGNPFKMIDRIKAAGLRVLHKVSSVKMALTAQEAGVDAVIATGYEAGGHIGRDEITTLCLVPQLVDALAIPVVAAGGIGDARGLVAALALGAEGVEMGTRFVATRDCPAPAYFKQAIVASPESATVVLGKKMPMRVLKNRQSEWMADPDKAPGKKDGQAEDDAYAKGDADTAILPAGQVAALIKSLKDISRVFPEMIEAASELSAGLNRFFSD